MRCGTPTPTSHYGIERPREPDGGNDAARREALQKLLGADYALRGKLGSGGFADVYEAWDVRLKRSVAVKTLRADLQASEALIERFKREAEAIAMLRHPNVIPIYMVGGDATTAYFVMPKVDGESLASVLERERKLGVDEACRILAETAAALETAHAAGVIHRDIKPENILLDGPRRRVLVTDFGIAKSLGGGGTLTGTGVAIGTPQYMSPEQASGDKQVDHRADQYSLAIVGYRMLSGDMPFEADSLQGLIMKQIMDPPRPLLEVAPDVPPAIGAVLQRALEKEPAKRWPSTEEFGRALADATRGPKTGSQRLRVDDVSRRMAALQRDLPGWKSPKVMGAAVALVAGLVMMALSESPVAMTVMANEADAVFAAKNFLSAREGNVPMRDIVRGSRLSVEGIAFLERKVPREIESRAQSELPFWAHEVHFRLRGVDSSIVWHVDVGPGNRIAGHSRHVADSASAPAVTPAQAESIAVAELRRFGHDTSKLRRVADSTIRLANRTDYLLRWSRPGSAIAWKPGSDSGWSQLQVRVMGSSVLSYRETLKLPALYPTQQEASSKGLVVVLVSVLIFGGLVLGVVLLVQQARRDELQWMMAARVGAAVAVVSLLVGMVRDVEMQFFLAGTSEQTTPVGLSALGSLAILIISAAVFMILAALVESLSAEVRPAMFGGIADLARGKFVSPEFVRAMFYGALWAGVIVAVHGAIAYGDRLILGTPRGPEFTGAIIGPSRPFQAVQEFGGGLIPGLLLASVMLAFLKWFRRPWLAWGIPLAYGVLTAASPPSDLMPITERVSDITLMVMAIGILWHGGILAYGVAYGLAAALPDLVALARYGEGGVFTAVVSLALIAAPLALGVVAYRRLARRAARQDERTATF